MVGDPSDIPKNKERLPKILIEDINIFLKNKKKNMAIKDTKAFQKMKNESWLTTEKFMTILLLWRYKGLTNIYREDLQRLKTYFAKYWKSKKGSFNATKIPLHYLFSNIYPRSLLRLSWSSKYLVKYIRDCFSCWKKRTLHKRNTNLKAHSHKLFGLKELL